MSGARMRVVAVLLLMIFTCAAGPATLRQAASGRFLIGTAVTANIADQPEQASIVAAQFDAITAENDFKPERLQPQPGQFRFEAADRIADFARKNHQALMGHTLCWHNQTPRWMFESGDRSPLPPAEGVANLKKHIDTVVGHFRGKVLGWDVVNEAVGEQGDELRDTPARRSIGDDYIIRAYQFAHAADPDAELYYNDYNIERGPKLDRTLRLIQKLKAAGARLDAVGVQGHWGLRQPSIESIERGIVALHGAGVRVQITELDIDMLPWKSDSANVTDAKNRALTAAENPYATGIPEDVLREQAARYQALFQMLLRHRDAIERVTFWGTFDGGSWLNNFPLHGRTNFPLLFDRQYKPKPAFFAVLQTLKEGK